MQTKTPMSPSQSQSLPSPSFNLYPNNNPANNPKYKRDFLYQNNEDTTRHLETFNNTGLNASSSDGQMTPKQLQMKSKGFRNVRSSIIHENNSDWERETERERERGQGGCMKREMARSEDFSSSVGDKLNNIWAISSKAETEKKENIRNKNEDESESENTDVIHKGRDTLSFLRGLSTTSSSNTIHIGLNIEVSPSEQSLSSVEHAERGNERGGGENGLGGNVDSLTLPCNPLLVYVEDDIDNDNDEDEDETDDVFAVDGDIHYQTTLTRRYPSTGSASSASSGDSRSSANSSTESVSEAINENQNENENESDTETSSSVCVDSKGSHNSSIHSSSRLMSSNPSFPAHAPHSSLTPSLSFSSSPSPSSSSFPSSLSSMGIPHSRNEKPKPKPECYFSSPGLIQRLCIKALAHPFLVVSVKMVTTPELRSQNWIYSYVHIVSRSGLGGLYSGIR